MDGRMVSSSSSETEINKQKTLFGSALFKHARPNGEDMEGQEWRFSKMARGDHGESVQEQMLSFATSHSDESSLPYYYFRNQGLSAGGLNVNNNMQGALARVRGPFTPSQWLELEHQALIYKYLASNAPIPQNLLFSIKRNFLSSGFASPFSAGYFGSSACGWAGYQMQVGYGGNGGDAEPGRCRRTDGKKWRCSRDAVPDQKYCERHINRGRHRSRKHVEAARSGCHLTAAAAAAPQPSVAAVAQPISGGGSGGAQGKTKEICARLACSSPSQLNRLAVNNETERLSLLTPIDSATSDFGSHSLHHFIDCGFTSSTPTDQPALATWPSLEETEETDTNSTHDCTQLSISFPFSSSPASMGGPLGEVLTKKCVTNSNTSSSVTNTKGPPNQIKGLYLLTDGWDLDSSPRPESSPTGVLQKTAFGSLSSSAGSSPRPESYKTHEDLGSILVNHLNGFSSI